MAATAVPATTHGVNQALDRARSEPAYGAFLLLRIGFTVLPILMGLDKFANVMTNWEHYLAPWIVNLLPFSAHTAMLIIGVIEIVAGVLVALKPRYAAYIVALWLAGIITNLLTYSGFYDGALRDLGPLLTALTRARRATCYRPARQPTPAHP
mgnify:CR=1 FL=1